MYRKEEQLMEMTLRWYGSDYDTVTLEQIRQIPGVTGVITTLYGTSRRYLASRRDSCAEEGSRGKRTAHFRN